MELNMRSATTADGVRIAACKGWAIRASIP